MLYADARSVREERSRQRYALQEFSLLRVSLIKGKHSWKVGSIEALQNYYQTASSKAARGSVVSIFRLLRRFVKGEEPVTELFALAEAGLAVLVDDIPDRLFVEEVLQLRMLALLGYVDIKKIPPAVMAAAPAEIAQLANEAHRAQIGALYTHAINMSHL